MPIQLKPIIGTYGIGKSKLESILPQLYWDVGC
jgi:hypothetical protein